MNSSEWKVGLCDGLNRYDAAMTITIQIFAALAEALKTEEMTMELPAGATVGDVLDRIADEHLHFTSWRDRTAIAVNHDYVDAGHVLNDGDELALIPPVSGG